MRVSSLPLLVALLVTAPRLLTAQERGAAALSEAVRGLGVTTRVLMIGAHPDDEDTQLLTWLARGQRVETAYLSLTRGDGGQNLIGNELGEALGVIRTEELLAARRVDGARQYFTRAYDFGFSKSAEETYGHWDKALLLRDVVSVVRAFRPHVIISVFSGTPRDGHGHHQVAGMLAREAYDVAGDTARIPAAAASGLPAWTPLKFYRAAWFNPAGATLRINVGEYDPVIGRSYAEIAGESRSQHRSQAFGTLQPKGVRWDQVTLEASRVSDVAHAKQERSVLDGIAPGWSRFTSLALAPDARRAIDSLPVALADVARTLDLARPERAVASLATYVMLLQGASDRIASSVAPGAPMPCDRASMQACAGLSGDLSMSLEVALGRGRRALLAAAGVAVEALAVRELTAVDEQLPIVVEVHNRGASSVAVVASRICSTTAHSCRSSRVQRVVAPDSTVRDTLPWQPEGSSRAWWLRRARQRGMFDVDDGTTAARPAGSGSRNLVRGEQLVPRATAEVDLLIAGVPVRAVVHPVVYRFADPSEGEVRRPVAAVPAVSVLLARDLEYLPANRPVRKQVDVSLSSGSSRERTVTVALTLPDGLRADSASRTVVLPPNGSARVAFTMSGSVRPGTAEIRAVARSEGTAFVEGFTLIDYPHIPPQRFYRPATMRITAVDVRVPAGLNVAYIPGVGDNIPPLLQQLGVPLTVLDPARVGTADLSRFTTLVVGPRAYEANDALVAANARILDFARRGGTVVVQYGQYEIMRPGMMPYPVMIGRPHDRVTLEQAPVRMLDAAHRLLRAPNAITAADFEGWVQERGLYMPRSFDAAYVPLLEMNDPGESPNRGALLVAPYGKGTYVYTTLSFFRQLPAGVPGAARLFVNLLGAGN